MPEWRAQPRLPSHSPPVPALASAIREEGPQASCPPFDTTQTGAEGWPGSVVANPLFCPHPNRSSSSAKGEVRPTPPPPLVLSPDSTLCRPPGRGSAGSPCTAPPAEFPWPQRLGGPTAGHVVGESARLPILRPLGGGNNVGFRRAMAAAQRFAAIEIKPPTSTHASMINGQSAVPNSIFQKIQQLFLWAPPPPALPSGVRGVEGRGSRGLHREARRVRHPSKANFGGDPGGRGLSNPPPPLPLVLSPNPTLCHPPWCGPRVIVCAGGQETSVDKKMQGLALATDFKRFAPGVLVSWFRDPDRAGEGEEGPPA